MNKIIAASLAAITTDALSTSVQQEADWTFYDPPTAGNDPCANLTNNLSAYFVYSYRYDLCTCMVEWVNTNFDLCGETNPYGQDPNDPTPPVSVFHPFYNLPDPENPYCMPWADFQALFDFENPRGEDCLLGTPDDDEDNVGDDDCPAGYEYDWDTCHCKTKQDACGDNYCYLYVTDWLATGSVNCACLST